MADDLRERCKILIENLKIGSVADVSEVQPLTGGVASDIARVTVSGRRYCVKFALDKMKVAQDWRAPVHRNKAEYAWISTVAKIAPDNVPRLFGRSDSLGGFVMEYLEGADIRLWKQALLADGPSTREVAAVATVLGRIHAATAAPGFDAAGFDNRDDFRALRLDPYLAATAARHPDLAARLNTLSESLYESRLALIHGDVSPKNILFRGPRPIILDAECATMGDPAFDVAFCLNHLVLKAFHMPARRGAFLAATGAFWDAYAGHVDWEDPAALQSRIAGLLPALMLARVDGKSPVEYLSESGREDVRRHAIPFIVDPVDRLADLTTSFEDDATND